jgi:hypothetical protein
MSPNHPKSAVMDVIETLELPDTLQAGQIYEQIAPYLSNIESDEASLEILLVKAGQDKTVNVATSKVANLKFRLKDLLLETSKTIVKAQSAKDNYLALTLIVLEFIQKARGMMEYTLADCDAQTLLEMYLLENDKEKITVENLFSRLQARLTQRQILQSLDLLEKLACIQYGELEISLVETIRFVPE